MGKNLSQFVKNSVADTSALIGDINSSGPDKQLTEFNFKHEKGHWVDLEATSNNLLHYKNVRGVVINARDITARKRWKPH